MSNNNNMSKSELLLKYKRNVCLLRENARHCNMSDKEIDEMFEDSFRILENTSKQSSRLCFILKMLIAIVVFSLFLFVLLNHHQPTLSLVLRNVQGLIYPSLKGLRLLAMPVIKIFPSLSELYDESCLIENPYFQVEHMECWPCEQVHSVINLTGLSNYSLYQSGIPYITKTFNSTIKLEDIQEMYRKNSRIFNEDAQRIKSNNEDIYVAEHLLQFSQSNSNTHLEWRINRMAPARIIRQLFPKTHIISNWSGQSMERFILIDDLQAEPYALPNPECGTVLLTQGRGERTIVLKPSKECSHHCRTTSVTLKESYSLFYNWWYWRPISLPSQNTTDLSISYLSSYC